MNITKLIAKLQRIQLLHGELEVVSPTLTHLFPVTDVEVRADFTDGSAIQRRAVLHI